MNTIGIELRWEFYLSIPFFIFLPTCSLLLPLCLLPLSPYIYGTLVQVMPHCLIFSLYFPMVIQGRTSLSLFIAFHVNLENNLLYLLSECLSYPPFDLDHIKNMCMMKQEASFAMQLVVMSQGDVCIKHLFLSCIFWSLQHIMVYGSKLAASLTNRNTRNTDTLVCFGSREILHKFMEKYNFTLRRFNCLDILPEKRKKIIRTRFKRFQIKV